MSVITLGRETLRPVPWRAVGVLVILALLLAVAAAVYVGRPATRSGSVRSGGQRPRRVLEGRRHLHGRPGDRRATGDRHGRRRRRAPGVLPRRNPACVRPDDGDRLGGRRRRCRRTQPGRHPDDAAGRRAFQCAWSPDGRSIAVSANDNGETGSLSIVDTVDRTIRKIERRHRLRGGPMAPAGRTPADGHRASVRSACSSCSSRRVDNRVEVLPTPVDVRSGVVPAGRLVARRSPVRLHRIGRPGPCPRLRRRARPRDPAEPGAGHGRIPTVLERRSTHPVHGAVDRRPQLAVRRAQRRE